MLSLWQEVLVAQTLVIPVNSAQTPHLFAETGKELAPVRVGQLQRIQAQQQELLLRVLVVLLVQKEQQRKSQPVVGHGLDAPERGPVLEDGTFQKLAAFNRSAN